MSNCPRVPGPQLAVNWSVWSAVWCTGRRAASVHHSQPCSWRCAYLEQSVRPLRRLRLST